MTNYFTGSRIFRATGTNSSPKPCERRTSEKRRMPDALPGVKSIRKRKRSVGPAALLLVKEKQSVHDQARVKVWRKRSELFMYISSDLSAAAASLFGS